MPTSSSWEGAHTHTRCLLADNDDDDPAVRLVPRQRKGSPAAAEREPPSDTNLRETGGGPAADDDDDIGGGATRSTVVAPRPVDRPTLSFSFRWGTPPDLTTTRDGTQPRSSSFVVVLSENRRLLSHQ
jgi:hypothetical protein